MPHKSIRTKKELSELDRLRARVLELEQSRALAPSGASQRGVDVSNDMHRAKTEQERDRLVAILETTSDLVAIADSTTQLSYMNEAGRRLLGWSANESLQEKTLADICPTWAAKVVVEAGVPAAVQFGAWKGETAIIGADGIEIRVSQVILAHRSQDGALEYLSTIIRDIRERRQAEKALQAILAGTASVTGEAFFQSLARQLSAALGVRFAIVAELVEGGNATTLAVWAKDRFTENFTYALSGTPCENVATQGICFYPSDVARCFPEDGTLAEMHVESYLGTPLRDAAGKTRGLLVVMDDRPMKEVTVAVNVMTVFAARAGAELGRKQAEERLKLTQFAIDHSTDGACWIGSDARFCYVNDTLCRWLGYARDELLQMSVHDIDSGFPTEIWPTHWQEMKRQNSMTFESQLRSKTGGLLPVEITTDLQEFDGCEYACAFVRDISERKRAEEDLRSSESHYRAVVEDQTEFIVRWMPDGTRTFVNEAYCRFFGRTSDQLVGTSFFPLVPKDQHQAILDMLDRLTPDAPVVTEEHQAIQPDGELCWQQWTNRAVFDSRGQIVELLSVGRDITDRVKAEREKAELQEQLHQGQKMEAIGQLAAGVAHDFNNILTVISAYTELIQNKCSSEGHLADWVGAIQSAVQQATGVTRSLLTFSHKLPAHKEPVDLCAVTTEAVHMLEHTLPASVELVTNTDCTPAPVVNADVSQLHQVILNLAVNARDAMPQGGTLNIAVLPPSCDEPTSTSAQGRRTPAARLVLRDTGVGMSPEVKARIFEPFFTTKGRGRGTGLGLAMTHAIVSDHGGWIDVQTKPGEGSTFTIHLPCVDSTTAGTKAHREADQTRADGELIILAEDQDDVREVVAMSLASVGYELLQAGDGESFLELVRNRRDDVRLCVVDVDLPKRTGLECLKAMRSDGVNVPAVVITGNPETLVNTHRDPSVVLLAKPFRMAELQRLVARLIAERKRVPQ